MSGWRFLRGVASASGMLLLCLLSSANTSSPARAALNAIPPNVVWAWERSEDLRWLPANVGVAYVMTTLELESGRVRLRPRAYPLIVRPDTVTIPVIYVDASWRNPPVLDAKVQ